MTDFATLALRIDASEVGPAVMKLDKLAQAGGKVEASQKGMGVSVEAAERHMRKASIVLADLKAKEDAAAQGARGLGQAASQMAKDAQASAAGLNKVTVSIGAQRAGLQQLGYQLGDVATQFAAGVRPQQIFAQQGTQVIQAISLMAGGASRLGAFLTGPWGIALTVATVALSPLIGKLWETKDAADAMGDSLQDAAQKFYDSLARITPLSELLGKATRDQVNALGEVARLEREIAATRRAIAASGSSTQGQGYLYGRLSDLEAQRAAAQRAARTAQETAQGAIAAADVQAAAQRRVAAATDRTTAATSRATGSSRAHGAAIKAETDELADYQKKLNETFEKDVKATEALDLRIQGIKNETALLGMVGPARERAALAFEEEAFKAQAAADGIIDVEAAWQKYLAARSAQIDRQTALDDDAIAAERAKDAMRDAADAAQAWNDNLRDVIGSLGRIGGFGGAIGGILGVLTGNSGAIQGPIGDLLNVGIDLDPVTGEIRKLGDVLGGAINGLGQNLVGALANAGIGVMAGSAVFGKQGTTGQIASGLGGVLGGIGGSALAGVFSGGVASSLGGALASSAAGAGASALGAALGSALPVIGTILGGIAGAALTKLLSGAQRGSAIISGGDVSGYYGNNSQFKDASGQLAGNVLSALEQLTQQLGGTYDPSKGKVSIGVRDGNYYIDEEGRGYTKSSIAGVKGFGKDQEAAIAAAIKNLIDDGVIGGLREGTMRLINAGGDLEEQLAKALAFENVFKDIEQAASPFSAALDAMKAQFDQLKTVFKEAGASAEEFAQLQQYMVDQQQALIDQMSANYRSTFYTDAENAAYAQQQIAAKLGPLGYGSVDTVSEYRALVEATDALKNPELYGALMELVDAFGVLKSAEEAAADAARASAAQREAERAAARAERERQIEEARNNLRTAYQREAGELQQTIDRFGSFADTLAEFRKELFAGEEGAAGYAVRLAELRRVGALAAMGDEAALGALPGVGKDFLTSARARAGSGLEYQRAVAMVARYAGSAEAGARGMATEAQKQLDALDKQVSKLIDINEGVLSVEQAIRELIRLQGGGTSTPTAPRDLPEWYQPITFTRLRDRTRGGWGGTAANDEATGAPSNGLLERMADSLRNMDRRWAAMTRDGSSLVIATDDDSPINTVAA